jgi:hypothetical protein
MFNDKTVVWVLEYIFGSTLVILPLAGLGVYRYIWMNTNLWAAALFIVCLGVILISCASSMRQRMLLAKRIERLAEQIQCHTIS